MSDLVKRLRSMDKGWPTVLSTAADRIEKLERELRECRMQSISDGCQLQDYAEHLAAEKALADRLHSALENEVLRSHMPELRESQQSRAAYRKARGL